MYQHSHYICVCRKEIYINYRDQSTGNGDDEKVVRNENVCDASTYAFMALLL